MDDDSMKMVANDRGDSFKGTAEADDTELFLPPESLMEEYETALESVSQEDGDAKQE